MTEKQFGNMNIFDKLRIGVYNNKSPYPKVLFHTLQDRKSYKEYRDETFNLQDKFKEDLFVEYKVENNPKRELLYSKAWQRGHSAGLNEVALHFSDLVELIQ